MKATKSIGRLFKQPIVYYVNADGRRVPPGTPGARRVRKLSRKWYAKLKDPVTGRWKPVALSSDKGVAEKLLAKRLATGEAVRTGIADAWDQHRADPVEDYIPAFLKQLAENGDSERHIDDMERLLRAVLEGCEIKTLGELHASAAKGNDFLRNLTVTKRVRGTRHAWQRTDEPVSPRTKNLYRQAVVSFGKFLCKIEKRFPDNPLAEILVRPNPRAEQRRWRRALKPAQLQVFLDAVRQRPLQKALARAARLSDREQAKLAQKGRERALLYLTAVYSGLREGERAALRVHYLVLDDVQAARIALPGKDTKNGDDASIPLVPDLALKLREWVAGKQPDEAVFFVPGYSQLMRAWRKDLKAAGISYRDENGRYFDFHSLRKCLGSYLRLAGVDPVVSMKMLRHKDIRLTMEVYNDEELIDLRSVVSELPKLRLD